MKRLILGISAAAILTLGAVPNVAEACGGGYARFDPIEHQIQLVVTEHFSKNRTAVRLQRIARVSYDDSQARAMVLFVDRRERVLAQELRLAPRGNVWVVVGGSQPSIV